MSPVMFLVLTVAVTGVAAAAQAIHSSRRRAAMRALAAEHGLHYSPGDRFGLAARVAERFPVPGVAAVAVSQLIYGIRGERYRYVFLTEYTQGVVRTKKRLRRVVALSEPRNQSQPICAELTLAPENLPLIEQYRVLCKSDSL